ncbi:hypothetical protein HY382_02045 [Candidatus Curtissbacteria bacterium]|nr:hypothetical protein [Candidatus Curtissbacteria bacterium]
MRKISRIERLAKKEEKETVKKIFLLSAISIVLAIGLITVGIGLVGRASELFSSLLGGKDKTVSQNTELRRPVFDALPEFTKETEMTVSGIGEDGSKILLYVNGDLTGEADVLDGKFKIDKVLLSEGDNNIYAIATIGDVESQLSENHTIVVDKKEPKLEVETPFEGQAFTGNNRIRVAGKTDSDAQVYANGFLASVSMDGNFEVFVPVAEGETNIEIKSLDEAGNTKIESRKVSYKK